MTDVGFQAEEQNASALWTPAIDERTAIWRTKSGTATLSKDLKTATALPPYTPGTDFAATGFALDLNDTLQGLYITGLDKADFSDGDKVNFSVVDAFPVPTNIILFQFTYLSASDTFGVVININGNATGGNIEIGGDPYNGQPIAMFLDQNGNASVKVGGTASSPAYELNLATTAPTQPNGYTMAVDFSGMGLNSTSVTIFENPGVLYDGTIRFTDPTRGGPVNNRPDGRENRNFIVAGLSGALYTNEFGVLRNGDTVAFDFEGGDLSPVKRMPYELVDFFISWQTGEIVAESDTTSPDPNITSKTRSELQRGTIQTPNGDYLEGYGILELKLERYQANGVTGWTDGVWTVDRIDGDWRGAHIQEFAGNDSIVIQTANDALGHNNSRIDGNAVDNTAVGGEVLNAPARVRIKAIRI